MMFKIHFLINTNDFSGIKPLSQKMIYITVQNVFYRR